MNTGNRKCWNLTGWRNWYSVTISLIGSFSNIDGNCKDEARKNNLIGWMRKNNRAARAARTLAKFFDVICQMTTWNFQLWGFNDNAWTHNNKSFMTFHSLDLLQRRFYQSICTVMCSVNDKGCEEEGIIGSSASSSRPCHTCSTITFPHS